MIEFIFSLDYEIYGDGRGSLKDLVLDPGRAIFELFQKHGQPIVVFVEAAELEIIEKYGIDSAIVPVLGQIREYYKCGCEIGLHIHPQWYRGKQEGGAWYLDESEYNLCKLSQERIRDIVARSIDFLKKILETPDYLPFSFRAGNWLFQPSDSLAAILFEFRIKIDSSVFKGGFLPGHGIDYRPALKNGWFWKFSQDAAIPEPKGQLLEIPIYTRMVPLWEMFTIRRFWPNKRKGHLSTREASGRIPSSKMAGLTYPKKLDFCKMQEREFKREIKRVLREDLKTPDQYRPVVAIGHTKDLVDIKTVDFQLSFLHDSGVPVVSLKSAYDKCVNS